MTSEPTSSDILEAIQDFATHVEERFAGIDEKFTHVDTRFDRIEAWQDKTEKRLNRIEATMVTKSYLDDKLADLRGDLVLLARKQNRKLSEVIVELQNQHLIDEETAARLLALEPFPLP